MTQADLLASGGRLYVDVWEHKQPGIVALYGVALGLFGGDPGGDLGGGYRAIQLLHAVAGFATAALLWLAFRRVGLGAAASLVPGVLYLLFYGGPIFGGYWATAQVEIFLDPCIALALWLLLPRAPALGSGSKRVSASRFRLVLAGVALGSAVFWLKYSAAPLAGLALLSWWSPGVSTSREGDPFGARVGRVAAFAVGMSLPLLLLLGYFAAGARLGAFWDATIAFNLQHRTVSSFQPEGVAQWGRLLLIRPGELALLYLFSGVAVAGHLIEIGGVSRRARAEASASRTARDRLLAAGLLLWVLAVAQVVLQGKFWIYHYHVVLLPLVITSALGVEWLAQRLGELGPIRRVSRLAAASLVGLISIALLWPHASLLRQYVELHRMGPYWRGESSRQEYLATYRWGAAGDYDAAENEAVAARVARETQPDDSIFVWGFEPSVYRLSGRAPASRFLYDYPLMPEFEGVHQRHVELLMQDLEASKPVLVLVLHRDQNDLETRDSAAQLRALPALHSLLAREYRAAWRLGDFSALRRRAAESPATPEQ